jgi:hypothetical protein
MGMVHHSLSLAWNFISTSPWSPSIVFAAAEGMVLLLRLRASLIPWKALAACACVLIAASAAAYLWVPTLQEDGEVGIASVSALALRGWPIYPDPAATQRYIVAYGPLAFAARIPAYWLFGPSFFSFKLTGVLAFFASMAGLYRICRRYAPAGPSLVGLGCCCMVMIRFVPIPFWGRGDPFILCMTVLSIWAILEAPPWAALLAAGATFALLPNIKITAGAYLFPILWLLIISKGWKIAAGAVALGVVLFTLPFLSPQVSIANYWFSLNNSRHTLRLDILLRNLQYSVILFLPLITAILARARSRVVLSRDQAIYLGLAVCSIVTASFVGANFGSGPHHLVPCIVPILHLYFWLESESPLELRVWPFSRLAIAWTLAMLLFSALNVRSFLSIFRLAGAEREAVAEIRSVEAAHPGQIVEIGIGRDFYDFRSVYGALTTMQGQPYTIGGLAVRELQVAGVEIPDSTVQYIARCGTEVWLIPKGDPPFSAPDMYFGPDHPAFTAEFRETFLDHYKKTASGNTYDVWICAQAPS